MCFALKILLNVDELPRFQTKAYFLEEDFVFLKNLVF